MRGIHALRKFVALESAGGILLAIAAAIALVLANSLIDILSRILMRLTLPNMSIVITSAPCLKSKQVD